MDENSKERFEQSGRFGRKPRRMSGMAATLLRAKTFQDTLMNINKHKRSKKHLA